MTKKFGLLACCLALTACGGGGDPAMQMSVKYDGEGGFSGTAGSGWTEEDIRTIGNPCLRGERVGNVIMTPKADGSFDVRGTCV